MKRNNTSNSSSNIWTMISPLTYFMLQQSKVYLFIKLTCHLTALTKSKMSWFPSKWVSFCIKLSKKRRKIKILKSHSHKLQIKSQPISTPMNPSLESAKLCTKVMLRYTFFIELFLVYLQDYRILSKNNLMIYTKRLICIMFLRVFKVQILEHL